MGARSLGSFRFCATLGVKIKIFLVPRPDQTHANMLIWCVKVDDKTCHRHA